MNRSNTQLPDMPISSRLTRGRRKIEADIYTAASKKTRVAK
jgi:hypothetical protein